MPLCCTIVLGFPIQLCGATIKLSISHLVWGCWCCNQLPASILLPQNTHIHIHKERLLLLLSPACCIETTTSVDGLSFGPSVCYCYSYTWRMPPAYLDVTLLKLLLPLLVLLPVVDVGVLQFPHSLVEQTKIQYFHATYSLHTTTLAYGCECCSISSQIFFRHPGCICGGGGVYENRLFWLKFKQNKNKDSVYKVKKKYAAKKS